MKYNDIELLQTKVADGNPFRQEYVDSIDGLIEKKKAEGKKKRDSVFTKEALLNNKEELRHTYLEMIGYPFDLDCDTVPKLVKEEYIGKDDLAEAYRLSIEVSDGIKFYGVLWLPHKREEKAPLVICQHGGGGTPELCSDLIGENNYNFFTKRILERGCIVFCPSLMLWTFRPNSGETFPQIDIPASRSAYNDKLRPLGYTITGFEVYCIRRCIDYLVTRQEIMADRIGMVGLSYGGYFSLHTAAAEERIISAYDAASFNDRDLSALGDWVYFDAANKLYDAEVSALVAPRRLRIDVGMGDGVFPYASSKPEAERAIRYFELQGVPEQISYDLWKGGHRFDETLEGFDYFLEPLLK